MPEAPTPEDALEEEPARVRGAPAALSHGQLVLFPERDGYLDLVRALADDDGYAMCVDLCAVDYLLDAHRGLPAAVAPERFEVVVNLLSLAEHKRVRLRVQVPAKLSKAQRDALETFQKASNADPRERLFS